ncbi:MAG: hypothetical protein LC118_15020 [Dehalococcoidia bacterium]|nr:hypothetical protein [Dehalococcoidia bacterium]
MEVAKRFGRHQSIVSEMEQGQRRVDVVEFLRLAEILEADPLELLKKVMRS